MAEDRNNDDDSLEKGTTVPSPDDRDRGHDAAAIDAVAELPIVSRGEYELGPELGRGGMGFVVAGRDRRIGRDVAIKQIRPDRDGNEALRARFLREARITARLQHPGIAPVYEIATWEDGKPFYAMRAIGRRSLEEAIVVARSRAQRLALVPVVAAAAQAVAYAHSRGVIHRDLKPANIRLGDFGETVVVDWGLAHELDDHDLDEPTLGTPAYMPPEQAAGRSVDRSADVYALGATLHHVLTGVRPYHASADERPEVATVLARLEAGPPQELDGWVPAPLRSIVRTAMTRDASARTLTPTQLAEELGRFQADQLVGVHRYGLVERWRLWARRRAGLAIAIVVATAAVSVVSLISARMIAGERERAEAQRARADYGRLVAEAEAEIELDPLQAARKVKAAFAVDVPSNAKAIRVARRWLGRHLMRVIKTPWAATAVAATDDGRMLASSYAPGIVRIWDVVGWKKAADLSTGVGLVWGLGFSTDGKRLGVGRVDGALETWVLTDAGWQRGWTARVTHDAAKLQWRHADGGELVLVVGAGHYSVLDAADGTVRLTRAVPGLSDAALADDGETLAMVHLDDGPTVAVGQLTAEVEQWKVWRLGSVATRVAWADEHLFIGLRSGAVAVIERPRQPADGVRSGVIVPIILPTGFPVSVLSQQRSGIVVGWSNGALSSVSLEGNDRPLFQPLAIDAPVNHVAWIEDDAGSYLVVTSSDAWLRVVRVLGGIVEASTARAEAGTARFGVWSLAWHGQRSAIGYSRGGISIVATYFGDVLWCSGIAEPGDPPDRGDGRVPAGFSERSSAGVRVLAFSPDGARLLAGVDSGQVRLYDVSDASRGCPVIDVKHLGGPIRSISWRSSGDEVMVVAAASGIARWRVSDRLEEIVDDDRRPTGVQMASWAGRDSSRIVAVSLDRLVSWVPGTPPVDVPVPPDLILTVVHDIASQPGGDLVAVSVGHGSVLAMDAGGRLRWRTPEAGHVFSDVAFSPDGHALALARQDGRLVVLDAQTGEPLFDQPVPLGAPSSLTWVPGGTKIIVGGEYLGNSDLALVQYPTLDDTHAELRAYIEWADASAPPSLVDVFRQADEMLTRILGAPPSVKP